MFFNVKWETRQEATKKIDVGAREAEFHILVPNNPLGRKSYVAFLSCHYI